MDLILDGRTQRAIPHNQQPGRGQLGNDQLHGAQERSDITRFVQTAHCHQGWLNGAQSQRCAGGGSLVRPTIQAIQVNAIMDGMRSLRKGYPIANHIGTLTVRIT